MRTERFSSKFKVHSAKILNPWCMLVTGLVLGVISRVLDIYTQNLGNIFSGIAIWILFGVIISIYSPTKKSAMLNILPFCLGMLATYYAVAVITNGVYSTRIIAGWTLFALFSPLLAGFAWTAKEKGVLPKIISTGIVLVSVSATLLLFHKLRIYDFFINAVLIYFLFFRKIKRH